MDIPPAPNSNEIDRRPRRRFTKEERSRHLSAWAESGLSAQGYANQHGFPCQYLYIWRKRANDRTEQLNPDHQSPFIAVRWKEPSPCRQPLTATLRHGGFEVAVTGGGCTREMTTLLRAIKEEVFSV